MGSFGSYCLYASRRAVSTAHQFKVREPAGLQRSVEYVDTGTQQRQNCKVKPAYSSTKACLVFRPLLALIFIFTGCSSSKVSRNSGVLTLAEPATGESNATQMLKPLIKPLIKPLCLGEMVGDTKEGPWTCYFSNSVKSAELFFVHGKKNGLSRHWREDGILDFEAHWRDGQFQGLTTHYFKNGNVQLESNFNNGQLDGVTKEYFESGKLATESSYQEGRLHGAYKEWDMNGKLIYESDFQNGFQSSKEFGKDGND